MILLSVGMALRNVNPDLAGPSLRPQASQAHDMPSGIFLEAISFAYLESIGPWENDPQFYQLVGEGKAIDPVSCS